MAFQLLGARDQLHDGNGNPLSGGSVDVFAAGTTTRVTTWSDSDLTQANANPVPLNGSGRANIWLGTQEVDVRILDASGTVVTSELGLNTSNIDGGFDGGLVTNGSFEIDTNSDDVPDGWTSENNAAGSNNGLETGASNTGAGVQSWRTQSSGNGGGELVTSSAFPVNDFDDLVVRFVLRSTVAAVRNIVRVEWYDVTDTLISNTDVYDSTSNPASFTQQTLTASPPSGARLGRLRIIGGTTGGTLAGITYWDNVNVNYPPVITGQFDNILLGGNSIQSTDTNGPITLNPNGTGDVNIEGPLDVNSSADFSGLVTLQAGATTSNSYTTTGTGKVQAGGSDTINLTDSDAPLTVGTTTSAHLEFDNGTIQAKGSATLASALGLNSHGGSVALGELAANSANVFLRNQSTIVAASQNQAIVLQNTQDGSPSTTLNSSIQNVSMRFQNASGSQVGLIGFEGSNRSMSLQSNQQEAEIRIRGVDAITNVVTMAEFRPGDGVSLFHDSSTAHIVTRIHDQVNAVSGAQIRTRDGGFVDIAPGLLVEQEETANFTLSMDHAHRFTRLSGATTFTVTFPDTTDIPIGAWGLIGNNSTFNATLSEGSGVDLFSTASASANVTLADRTVAIWWHGHLDNRYWIMLLT